MAKPEDRATTSPATRAKTGPNAKTTPAPIATATTTEAKAASKPGQPSKARASALTDEEISQRAYELYQQRGAEPGNDMDDWLQAERELQKTKHS